VPVSRLLVYVVLLIVAVEPPPSPCGLQTGSLGVGVVEIARTQPKSFSLPFRLSLLAPRCCCAREAKVHLDLEYRSLSIIAPFDLVSPPFHMFFKDDDARLRSLFSRLRTSRCLSSLNNGVRLDTGCWLTPGSFAGIHPVTSRKCCMGDATHSSQHLIFLNPCSKGGESIEHVRKQVSLNDVIRWSSK
jgi:hypothetical protein